MRLENVDLVYRNVPKESVRDAENFLDGTRIMLQKKITDKEDPNPVVHYHYSSGEASIRVAEGSVVLNFLEGFFDDFSLDNGCLAEDGSRMKFSSRSGNNKLSLDCGKWSEYE